jgi:hypothetical protein
MHLDDWRVCKRHSTWLLEPQVHDRRLYRSLLEDLAEPLECVLYQGLQGLEVSLLDYLWKLSVSVRYHACKQK